MPLRDLPTTLCQRLTSHARATVFPFHNTPLLTNTSTLHTPLDTLLPSASFHLVDIRLQERFREHLLQSSLAFAYNFRRPLVRDTFELPCTVYSTKLLPETPTPKNLITFEPSIPTSNMASQDITAAPIENSSRTRTHDAAPVDRIGELSKDEQQITTASHAHDSAIGAPRANFPLPRELRDHIYSYLLDAEHTRVKRARVGDRAYNYHTNILGVNRQIHDEAEEYLYKNNIFIVIGYHSLDSQSTVLAPHAPFVARLRGVEFMYHTVDVQYSAVLQNDSEHSESPRLNLLFLSKDLDSYCRIASLTLASRLRFAPKLIINDNNVLVDCLVNEEGKTLSPDHMKIEFRSHRFYKKSCGLQASFLDPLCTLARPGLLVSISGNVLDPTLARDLEVSKATNLACVSAISWQFLRILHCIKASADVSAQAGELVIAASLYGKIVRVFEALRHNPLWQAPEIKIPFIPLWIDTLLTQTNMYKHAKDPTSFARTVAHILRLIGPSADGDRRPVASCIFHKHMLATILLPSEKSLPPFPSVTIAGCIDRLSVTKSRQQAHDVAILKKCADQNKIFTPEDLPVAACSFFVKKGRMACFARPISKPDRIVGYVDALQLRNLDKATRERINELQRERGWGITRFEDYDEVDSQSEVA
jgi:hypothetical protein